MMPLGALYVQLTRTRLLIRQRAPPALFAVQAPFCCPSVIQQAILFAKNALPAQPDCMPKSHVVSLMMCRAPLVLLTRSPLLVQVVAPLALVVSQALFLFMCVVLPTIRSARRVKFAQVISMLRQHVLHQGTLFVGGALVAPLDSTESPVVLLVCV